MKWEIFLLYIFFHLIWQNSSCLYEPVPHVMRTEHIFTFKGIGFLNRTAVNTRLQRKKRNGKKVGISLHVPPYLVNSFVHMACSMGRKKENHCTVT